MIYRMPVVGILFSLFGAPPGLTALLGNYIRGKENPATSGNIRHVKLVFHLTLSELCWGIYNQGSVVKVWKTDFAMVSILPYSRVIFVLN